MLKLNVDNGGMKAIAAELGINRITVSLALNGARASKLARKIRALAVRKYNATKVVELTQEEKDYELGQERQGV